MGLRRPRFAGAGGPPGGPPPSALPPFEKGKGKGKGKFEKPAKFSEELWENSREKTGLTLLGEICPPNLGWVYPVKDEPRRSFAAYLPSPFSMEQCQVFFNKIKECTKWFRPEGANGPIPRKTAWMVSNGCSCIYRYGSTEVNPEEFPPWMLEIMQQTMPYYGLKTPAEWPNSCNLNLYDDGEMSVGWHSDDEKLFQGKMQDIRILSLSFGARRKFELRPNWPEEGERPLHLLRLGNGDLSTMEGMIQKHYQHRVPKEGNCPSPRINLTWRWVIQHTPRCPAKRPRFR